MFKFESNVKDHQKLIREAAIKALTAGTLVAEDNAVQLAPVDTGRLRSDIHHNIEESELESVIGNTVEYAPHIEYGTKNQPQQAYIRPALQNKNVKQAVENEMRKAVDDA